MTKDFEEKNNLGGSKPKAGNGNQKRTSKAFVTIGEKNLDQVATNLLIELSAQLTDGFHFAPDN
jgi:hypothetical protein